MNQAASEEHDIWGTDSLRYVDSIKRPEMLAEMMAEAAAPEHLWRLFQMGWPICDRIRFDVHTEIMLMLISAADDEGSIRGTQFLEGDDKAFFDSLPDTVTIYRGCAKDHTTSMAWTTDREIAQGFARGHRNTRVTDGAVYQATVLKEQILTVFTERDEAEIIVNPYELLGVAASTP